jgi:hypothetical protein
VSRAEQKRHSRDAIVTSAGTSRSIGLEQSRQPIQYQFQESPVKLFGHTILVTGGSAGTDLKEILT